MQLRAEAYYYAMSNARMTYLSSLNRLLKSQMVGRETSTQNISLLFTDSKSYDK